jgi:hypothetical protein
VQIIGRATRDAPGKTRARFTNLIAEPLGEQARRGLSVWSDALPVRRVMLEVACEPSVVGSL